MTKEIVITLEFESKLGEIEVSEVAREIMSDLLSRYYLTGVKYALSGCEEE